LQIQQLGSLDDIEIVEVDSPELLPGQIRVAVLASGLNYVDSLMIEGKYQIKPPVPYRPGSEIVGRVVEVASDVTNLEIGDRVFSASGGFADEAVLSSTRVIAIPDQLSDGQGATFMQSYLTAWFAFHKRAQVREGATMLVLGVGVGVGAGVGDDAAVRWRVAPVAVVEQGRVAVGDPIGELLDADIVVVLIGERPGLSSPDSLGIYFTWAPRPGRNDAERNCISNVRPEGLGYAEAATRLVYLLEQARSRQLTGVGLKDESGASVLATEERSNFLLGDG
jgi:hypothetical protein